ncbi:Uncharacterised protein [Vibrio cholerae]|nr:Uncharacterised protein [Vibrio cholerae]
MVLGYVPRLHHHGLGAAALHANHRPNVHPHQNEIPLQ